MGDELWLNRYVQVFLLQFACFFIFFQNRISVVQILSHEPVIIDFLLFSFIFFVDVLELVSHKMKSLMLLIVHQQLVGLNTVP